MRTFTIYPDEFPEPWASDWGEDEYGLWMGFTYKGVKQLFRWIEPGSFMMGSPSKEPERFSDETQHSVNLTQGFWLAECTVTQALWLAVMDENPSYFKGENLPVERVSWQNAQAFINRLNDLKPALKLCLPTEAQWEYACRAGTKAAFVYGNQIDSSQVNFDGTHPYNSGTPSEYRGQTVVVKTLPPNAWGLYEMHGNVVEWCQDWYDTYSPKNIDDPRGPDKGTSRVLRGGYWVVLGRHCRSACRLNSSPGDSSERTGFRLARGHWQRAGDGLVE